MMPGAASFAARAGFTLLEVLAALAVLGLIVAAIATAMRFAGQSVSFQAHASLTTEQVLPVDETLRALVARAWPDDGGAGAEFVGTARTLSFRTEMPESMSSAKIRDADVTIGVDLAHRLTVTWRPWYRKWIVPLPAPLRSGLLSGVDHVEFAYWDPSLHLPPGGWVTAWVAPTVPRLLRIRLVFQKKAGLRWPDIIVATARDPFVY